MSRVVIVLIVSIASSANADKAKTPIHICVQPLGSYDKQMATDAVSGIQYLFGTTVELLPGKKMPRKAYYKPRKRYRADKILDYLDTIVPARCHKIVGFTKHDISTTKPPHKDWGVLGLGEAPGNSCVVSTYRAGRRVSRYKKRKRSVKVVNHELGHTFGLPHVDGKGCLMEDAKGTVRTVDGESGLFCADSIDFIENKNSIQLPRHKSFDWKKVLRRK